MPPEPGSPEWHQWASEQLADADYDSDLGHRMAEDALRVADGELSKAQFHERYSDEIEAEFGVDERPTKSATDTPDDDRSLPRVPGDHNQSRRNVLMAMGGIGVGALTLGEYLGPNAPSQDLGDNPNGDVETDKRMGMVIDTTECIACLQCSEACKEENNTDTGVHWPYVFRYEDELEDETREGYLTRHCQHCAEPSCTFVCPTQARYQRQEDGIVLTDYDTCVGCKYCQVACPYGVNYLGKDEPNEEVGSEFEFDTVSRDDRTVAGPPPKGVMGKRTFCVHRQDADEVDNGVDPERKGTTACQQACPENVIQFGDLEDEDSAPRQYLRGDHEDAPSGVEDRNRYKLLDDVGNEPNIIFLGQQPSKDAEPIEGPRAYEDMGMLDGAYEYAEELRGESE